MRARLALAAVVVLLFAVCAGACKDYGVVPRPRIAVSVEDDEMTEAAAPRVKIPFVATGSTFRIRVPVQNTGDADLEIEVPEVTTVDWVWAAGLAKEDPHDNLWPVADMTLGGQIYDLAALVGLLERNDAGKDASVALVQALIPARLIIESGGPKATIGDAVAEAEAWLDANAKGALPWKVDPTSAAGAEAVELAAELAAYDEAENPHLSFDPDDLYTDADFPLVVAPDDSRELQWLYEPVEETGQERDDRPVMLTVLSNDGYQNEAVRILIEFTNRQATIRVQPSVVILVNPTSARPVSETVFIHNDGSDRLIIESIALERADDSEYDLIVDTPASEWYVLPPSDPGYQEMSFQVRYAPRAAIAENAILITSNDVTNRVLRVPIRIEEQERAICTFTYEDEAKGFLDFAGRPAGTEKVINIHNEGPSNCNVKNFRVQPDTAAAVYTVHLQKPPTQPGAPPDVVSPPLSLARDRSAEIVVTFNGNPDDPQNGTLGVEYENPQPGHFVVPILGGAETPVLDLAPSSKQLHFVAAQGSTDRATFVIANTGNGDLTIHNIAAYEQWAPGAGDCDGLPEASPHFSIEGGPLQALTVASFDLLPVTVGFSPQNDEPTRTSYVQIAYEDPNGATPEERCQLALVTLIGSLDTTAERPVAAFSAIPAAPVVGESVLLDAGASTAPAGDELWTSGYSWYLADKPAGSKALLNETAGPVVQFTPDQAGTYSVMLVVFTASGVYSAETSVELVVE